MKLNFLSGKVWLTVLVLVILTGVLLVACGENVTTSDPATPPDTGGTSADDTSTNDTSGSSSTETTGGDMKTQLSIPAVRINMTTVPLGIDSNPAFGWTVSSDIADNGQKAYRVCVYGTKEDAQKGEKALWNSGKVESPDSASVAYSGDALKSTSTYFCTVEVWDKFDNTVKSEPVEFRTGIFAGDKWKGEWITQPSSGTEYNLTGAKWIWYSGRNNKTSADGGLPAETVYFRFKFTPKAGKTVSSAHFVFTADDYVTVYVNGATLIEIPNQTDIWKTGNVVDIAPALNAGENLIAAKVTNSSVGYAGFVGKLFVVYTDGTQETRVTDQNAWKASQMPPAEWNTLSYDDSSWKAPDQYVTYGGSPWNQQCVISNEGDRAAILLRKEFTAKADVTEATVYMSGIGYSTLRVNGTLADDCFLDPCNTQYNKTVLYRTFDVTSLVKSGAANALAVELGNGFYNEEGGVWNWGGAEWKDTPKLLFWMVVKYADGTTDTVISDDTWKATNQGPTSFNSIYYGEYYDARKEMTGWDKPGYDDSAWSNAVKAKAPAGKLECQLQDPVRRTETFAPTEIKKLSDGSYVVYCPEMVAGWAKLNIKGAEAGQEIILTYSEKLNSNGSVQRLGGKDGVSNNWWPEFYIMTDHYTAKGDAVEVFEPKFSYKGFRYIQIWNYPGELTKDDVVIYRTSNDVATTGAFECSNDLLNKMHQMMLTTVKNNLQGKPTDCPVWEKNGWLGDFNVALASMNYNLDMSTMTENFVEIMESCFEQYGLVPPMVPTAGWNIGENYVWNTVYVFAVYDNYKVYGSLEYLKEQYATMKKYADGVVTKMRLNRWVCPDGQLGDWVSPVGTNPNANYNENPSEGSGIVGTALVYQMLNDMSEIANLLGYSSDAASFQGSMQNIYKSFNTKFFNKTKGYYETTTWNQIGTRTKYRQSSNLLPLAVGLVPEENRTSVIESLLKDIRDKKNHLDTGCVGTKFILPVLSDLGYGDLAYSIATQTTYPSWGFMIAKGSTSLWEMWEATSRSLDHYFLGTYEEWFYSHLAGIKDMNNGYETFTVQPYVLGDLSYVTCSVNTVRGKVESSWVKGEDGTITMTVEIPFGSTATVILPVENPASVTVNGSSTEAGTLTLGSGRYTIVIK